MPPVWSWMAKPSSKLLDEKSPEGTVTDPSTVTTVPSGSWRAAPMSIGCESLAAADAGIAASARQKTARPAARRDRLRFSREARNMGRSSWFAPWTPAAPEIRHTGEQGSGPRAAPYRGRLRTDHGKREGDDIRIIDLAIAATPAPGPGWRRSPRHRPRHRHPRRQPPLQSPPRARLAGR